MVDDINKMLKIVADATTELENKIIEYLGKDICVDIINVDYNSFALEIANKKLYKEVTFDYHVLMDSIIIYYCNWDSTTFTKNFKTISDAFEDIKEFLNKEE